jgi:TonB family protein
MRSLTLLPLLLAASSALVAQGGAVPGERRVMVDEAGTTLSIDSLTIVHSGATRFTVNTVTRFPGPVALPSGDSIDREVDLEEIDCGDPRRVRSLLAQLFLGERLVDVEALPGRWTLVPVARVAAIQASCDFLMHSFAAALPVEIGPESVDREPVLVNPAAVLDRTLREYPAALGDSATDVAVRFRVTPDGRVERETIRVLSLAAPEVAEAARRVAMAMRFRPAVIRGVPVAVWISQPVRFARSAARATAP